MIDKEGQFGYIDSKMLTDFLEKEIMQNENNGNN
jgi:hypothetical protein